jgi:hypothetical protein
VSGESPVVWFNRGDDRCASCGVECGDYVSLTREKGVRCLKCAGLEGLVWLPSGNPALTRRASALSSRHAVVVEWSRARKRNERRGSLVEAEALEKAKASCAADGAKRAAKAEKSRERAAEADREYVAEFARRVLDRYPGCPPKEAEKIARHACAKYSGRVGRTAAAKEFDPEMIDLAVRAHVRHEHTEYDELRDGGGERGDARAIVRDEIERVLRNWRGMS